MRNEKKFVAVSGLEPPTSLATGIGAYSTIPLG
jgi:hypothetical protein